jgi:hypothetical protein
VSRPVSRFTPSRRYLSMAMFAVAGTVLTVWTALRWGPQWLVGKGGVDALGATWLGFSPGWIAAALFFLPAVALLALAFRPVIEIHETHLRVGRRDIPWNQIRRLDQTGWNVPLAVYLSFNDDSRMLLIYAGDFDSSASLLRHLRRYSRQALLDGVPYRQFWGEPPLSERTAPQLTSSKITLAPSRKLPPPRYPLLRPEDEEEVERMFQRLKTVGHLERRDPDEK